MNQESDNRPTNHYDEQLLAIDEQMIRKRIMVKGNNNI
ncbi:hypothetical protein ABIA69_004245 [Lysinibacillus parviboronicapiens]|uniref:Uncharacterized protein n=1 Tax=Lysinibacillus parviboronicapiens TaxID=436516 RepID=A0ABV2PQ11_9BACI